MTSVWHVLVGAVCGVLILWGGLVISLWLEQRRHPNAASLRDLLRLVPDVVRLLKRLGTDPALSFRVRLWLVLLLVYLASPIDLIPDFIPVLGYLDDALVVALALRFATRHAGTAAVSRHWPGTAEGLAAVLRMAGLRQPG
jgi:uncharacterized membrane protein YkvA (DUF1232 family)